MTTPRRALAEGALLRPRDHPGTLPDESSRRPRIAERAIRLDNNRYILQEPLQQTGTTATWCAWDAPFERMVALRVFRSASDDFLRALAHDVFVGRRVESQHVQRIERHGRCESSGLVFIEAELCAEFADGRRRLGKTLAHIRPRTAREAARWARDVALGVHAAHREGLFHGAITSDCIWIRPVTGRAQIAQFGQALWRRADPSTHPPVFSPYDCIVLPTGNDGGECVRGAPCFMAPEQANGLALDDDDSDSHRRRALVDVYGVGAALYEMLAGVPPYLPDPHCDDPVQDVLSQVRTRPPGQWPPLPQSARGPSAQPPLPVPAQLRRILWRSMDRNPAARYPSAADLAADLTDFLELRPTRSDGLRPCLHASLWMRRHMQAAGLGLSLLISLMAALAALSFYRDVADARRRLRGMERQLDTGRYHRAQSPEQEPAP